MSENTGIKSINIQREIRSAAQSSGSTLTKIARSTALEDFVKILKTELNLHIISFEKLKTRHIQEYVDYLKSQNLSIRTIQNNLAHIRHALKHVGRDHFATSEQNSNKAFGASGASRDGTHKAIATDTYSRAVQQAQLISPGAAAAMQLQRELGLRAREAIQSVASLKSWQKSIEHNGSVHIMHGTKGGRSRVTTCIDKVKALDAVAKAMVIAKQNGGYLIESKSLQGAMRSYGRVFQKIGLTGESASHSLRCAYAKDKYAQYMSQYEDRREALAAVSLDLGHGDGRGLYVNQVYLKN